MNSTFRYAAILLMLLNFPASLRGADDSDRSPDTLHLLDGKRGAWAHHQETPVIQS